MDIMLNNTDITLPLNYKTLELDGFCTTQDTLDYEHSCIDRKDSIVRWSNVSSFFLLHFISVEVSTESMLGFGTRDVGVSDETLNIYKHYFIKFMLKSRIL